MNYVKSEDIKLYPCSNRGGKHNPEARLGTEFNITKMNSAIASRKSFVIDYNKANDYIEFSINGYYFRIDNISNYLPNTEKLYANIEIGDKGDGSYHLPNLQPLSNETTHELDSESDSGLDPKLDSVNIFVGLSLTDSTDNLPPDYESLLLLKKDGDNWTVPLTSKLYKSGEDILPDTDDQNIGSESLAFNEVHAKTINAETINANSLYGTLYGTADKAKEFDTAKSITLTGDIDGTISSTGKDGWTIETTIPSDTVKTAMISNSQVTTDKINDSAITTTKLADNSITKDKLAAESVTKAKLADDSVTEDKIVSGTITNASISDSANIDGSKIADTSIAGSKLADNTITSTQLGSIISNGTPTSANGITIGLNQTDNNGGLNLTLNCSRVTNALSAGSANTADSSDKSFIADPLKGITKVPDSSNYKYTYLIGTYNNSSRAGMEGKELSITSPLTDDSYALAYDKITNTLVRLPIVTNENVTNLMLDNFSDNKRFINIYGNAETVTNGFITIGETQVNLGGKITNISTPGTITASSFYATSDERLKENIVDYKYHNSILDLPVKQFNYKSDPAKTTIGCIAQELQSIYPELVETDEDGYLKIAENKLVYLLLEEVKLLKEEIKRLKEGN